MLLKPRYLALAAVSVAVACSDAPMPAAPSVRARASSSDNRAGGNDRGERFVAIGTSISMGWQSNGVYAGSQIFAWPELLAFGTGRPISLPLIQSPGCTSPLVAPLGGGVRLSGESAAGSTVCAPLVSGVTLPTQDLGIAGALAVDALQTTPETASPSSPWYGRVLQPGTTQLTAALGQHPTFISVELGGNEVLNATSGLFAPGVTVVPLPFYTAPYAALLDAIGSTQARAVLVGLPSDARNFPALRRGTEIWADRAEFGALHIDVSSDCAASPNYINVSVKSLNLAFTAAFTSANGLPNPVFSCADVPGTADLVLTPADIAATNALLAQMDAFVRAQAASRGYAYFSLGALFDRPDLKPRTYSVIAQLTSKAPYGLLTSLDGVHPSALGHAVLALAAARAINATYGRGHDDVIHAANAEVSFSDRLDDELPHAFAIEQARLVASRNRNVRVAPCGWSGGCDVGHAMHERR